jgi:hypothetical protein
MADQKLEPILQRVRAHAVGHLPFDARTKTNLYVDERIIPAGETIGPRRQKIAAGRPSVLVFADDQPTADFSHPCRYLLYESETGNLHREVAAQFPPYAPSKRDTFKVFHEPVKLESVVVAHRPTFHYRCPIMIPDGNRFALLFSGMSNVRHLNNLEFAYRTLVDDYAFKPENIYVLNYDGTLDSQDGVPASYVADGTPYRMKVTGQGTRTAFESAISDIKGRIKSHDTLFLYTGNHGGWDNVPGSADLCTYPYWDAYHASDLASALSQLPHFRSLLTMMSQCHSGGFNSPILAASTADATSVASSVSEPHSSSVNYDWNYFARDWTSAQAGRDPYNAPLAFNPDTNGDSAIQAEEAFNYAYTLRAAGNDPVFSESSEAGGDVTLGQAYAKVAWWCPIVFKAVEKHYLHLPPEEYQAKLHAAQPQLTRLAMELDQQSNHLQDEYRSKVERIIAHQVTKAASAPR